MVKINGLQPIWATEKKLVIKGIWGITLLSFMGIVLNLNR